MCCCSGEEALGLLLQSSLCLHWWGLQMETLICDVERILNSELEAHVGSQLIHVLDLVPGESLSFPINEMKASRQEATPPLQYHCVRLDPRCAASSTGWYFQKLGYHKVTLWEDQMVYEKTSGQLGKKRIWDTDVWWYGGTKHDNRRTKYALAF